MIFVKYLEDFFRRFYPLLAIFPSKTPLLDPGTSQQPRIQQAIVTSNILPATAPDPNELLLLDVFILVLLYDKFISSEANF